MPFDLILIRLHNDRARAVLAHQLASRPDISLEKAFSMLDSPPVLFQRDLDLSEAEQQLKKLHALGADVRIIESHHPASETPSARDAPAPASPETPKKKIIRASLAAVSPSGSGSAPKRLHRPRPDRPRGGRRLRVLIFIIVCAAAAAGLWYARRRHAVRLGRGGLPGSRVPHAGSSVSAAGDSASSPERHDLQEAAAGTPASRRAAVPAGGMRRSRRYVDSAVVSVDREQAVRFYKIAISFNRYNAGAWTGLIDAYTRLGRHGEARAAKREMMKLFGTRVETIDTIIRRFGRLEDAYRTAGGTYRIVYRTRRRSREELLEETWRIVRRVRPVCGCRSLSLHAGLPGGTGLAAYVSVNPPPASYGDYLDMAKITYLR